MSVACTAGYIQSSINCIVCAFSSFIFRILTSCIRSLFCLIFESILELLTVNGNWRHCCHNCQSHISREAAFPGLLLIQFTFRMLTFIENSDKFLSI